MTRAAASLFLIAVVALLASGGLLSPTGAAAAAGTYHVSPTGSDAGNGSAANPWRTIQKATSTAPPGAVIVVDGGTYAPFQVTKPGQTVTARPQHKVQVRGNSSVQDVIRVAAQGVTLLDMTVSGCVPRSDPVGGYENNGSSAIRINDGASGVTVRGMTIRDSRGTNNHGLPFGCYGIFVHNADASRIIGNDISGTGTGVYFNGGGRHAVVAENRIHDNTVLVRNTPGNNDDYGASGVTFTNLSAVPGALATKNLIFNNAGPSSDYRFDGGAFEIYNASNTQIIGNTVANNENVLETGTGPGGVCANNVFVGNDATGRTSGSTLARSIGVILRCATAMVVDRNTFTGIDWYVYHVFTDDEFSSNVRGLAITDNTVDQHQKVYQLEVDPAANLLVVDGNRIRHTGDTFASYGDGTKSPDIADWRARTGLDRLSTTY